MHRKTRALSRRLSKLLQPPLQDSSIIPRWELEAILFQVFLNRQPIATQAKLTYCVDAPAAMIRGFGTSSNLKGTLTVDHSSGHMSPTAAGVVGKPRTQRPGKSTDEATKDKGKDNKANAFVSTRKSGTTLRL